MNENALKLRKKRILSEILVLKRNIYRLRVYLYILLKEVFEYIDFFKNFFDENCRNYPFLYLLCWDYSIISYFISYFFSLFTFSDNTLFKQTYKNPLFSMLAFSCCILHIHYVSAYFIYFSNIRISTSSFI